ncbi:MAG: DoxX family protein [Pirellulales bacterium]
MYAIRGLLTVLARIMLAAIFLAAIAGKATNFKATAESMANEGVPSPQILLGGAIAFLALGGLSVVLGLRGRIGALLLLVFLGAATYYFHDFWRLPADTSADVRQAEIIAFMKNVALMGAMLFLLANGTGPWSLDGRRPADDRQAAPDEDG